MSMDTSLVDRMCFWRRWISSKDGATRGKSNADPERQIQTRSTTQQTVFDAEPTTSQCHANYEVENPVRRQRHREADLSAIQHEREQQEGLKQQQYQKIVEQQELQELHRQTQKIQAEQELRRKLSEEQWLEKEKSQELQQQHQRLQLEQLYYNLNLREQSQNTFDRNDKLVDYRQQDSEMGHILTKIEEQCHLYGQQVYKSESHKQELDEAEGPLTDHSKTMMIENEIIVKDNQQYQCKSGKWNEPKLTLIESSSFDRDYYIAPKEQQTLEAQLQGQQQNLQKPHNLVHNQSLQQRKRKRLCNEKPRKEFEWRQLQRRLNLFSDESGLDNIFDNKLVRKISESELKGKQILTLRDCGDHHNLYYNDGNRGQYQPQNSMKEQPSKKPRDYTEVGSTQTIPPKSQQPQSLHEFKPEGLAKLEQQNSKFHEINTMLDRDDGETKPITVNPKEQLPPNDQILYKNEIEVHGQGLNERGGCKEIEIGTEIREIYKEHTQYNTDRLIDANKPIINENGVIVQSDDVYQQYRPKIRKLYKYSKSFAPLIENFVGTASSDEHYYIEESLTRILLELDRLPAENCQKLRLRRRKVIKYIYDLMGRLDDRVQATQ